MRTVGRVRGEIEAPEALVMRRRFESGNGSSPDIHGRMN
jgi:hypothetical protein